MTAFFGVIATVAAAASGPTDINSFNFDPAINSGASVYVVSLQEGEGNGQHGFDATYTTFTRPHNGNVIIEDAFQFPNQTFSFKFECETEGAWSLVRGEMIRNQGEREKRAVFTRDGDQVRVVSNGKSQTGAFPVGTVLEASLFRIVPQLPETRGAVYTFPAFAGTADVAAKTPDNGDFTITCKGNEWININGSKFKCTRYDVETDSTLSFYVDDTDRVRYVVNENGSTMRLVDERTAAVSTD